MSIVKVDFQTLTLQNYVCRCSLSLHDAHMWATFTFPEAADHWRGSRLLDGQLL